MKVHKLIIFLTLLYSCNLKTKSVSEEVFKKEINPLKAIENKEETPKGIVFFSSDKGLSWENKSDGLPNKVTLGLGAMSVNKNSLAIATKENGVYLFNFQKNIWDTILTDKKIIENNLGTIAFYNDQIFVGTQLGGVYYLSKKENRWIAINAGLASLTIRKLVQIDNKLYVGTDAGLYFLDDELNKWELDYGNNTMQVNGITDFNGSIYIGTNQGAFTRLKSQKAWIKIIDNYALHNIASDDTTIYALAYNTLLASIDGGNSWQNIQKGLPKELYTFTILKNNNSVFAGQWDGVYRKDNSFEPWKPYSNGLPTNLAITNMKLYKGNIVVTGNEIGLKKGMTTNK